MKQVFYRLADEERGTILVACSKCDWWAAFARDDLIGLAAMSCSKVAMQDAELLAN